MPSGSKKLGVHGGEEAEEHECPKNFEGRSKSMEASAILKMVEDAFLNRFFVIDIIVSDNYSTMQAVLKHPSKGARGQVIKSLKGKLHEDIPEPYFLADPSHRVKVVAKHIFSIVNKSRDLRCGCTKEDALRIKKYWVYMIKKNKEKTIEEFSESSKVPLEHMFNSHANCNSEWCFKKRASEEGKTYNKDMTNSTANKTTIICTISSRRLFSHFKQTKF